MMKFLCLIESFLEREFILLILVIFRIFFDIKYDSLLHVFDQEKTMSYLCESLK